MFVTSPFGWRTNPITRKRQFHEGIDVRAAVGTPVRALWPGVVSKIRETGRGGLSVSIDHGEGISTYYAHLSRVFVDVGDPVFDRQTFAYSGESGPVTGPHLHLAVYFHGTAVDPVPLMGG